MTREEANELLPIIQAFAEGKTIQVRINNDSSWTDLLDTKLEISNLYEYRIKPEPKYRPFKTQKECWQEMLKHQPFGWVKSKAKGYFHLIGLVQWESDFKDVVITLATDPNTEHSCTYIFKHYVFSDGTPFGMKEE